MQRDLSNITSATWCISLKEAGQVVQDIEVIKQRWYIALSTPAGSVPLDPYFASDIFSHIDDPANLAVPRIRAEILNVAKAYLPEIKVKSITYEVAANGVTYTISSTINSEIVTFDLTTALGMLRFDDYGGRLVLYDTYPLNASAYSIALLLDGKVITPTAPLSGFDNTGDLRDWCNTNWGAYGKFTSGKDVIVMVPNTNYSTGKLSVSAV